MNSTTELLNCESEKSILSFGSIDVEDFMDFSGYFKILQDFMSIVVIFLEVNNIFTE